MKPIKGVLTLIAAFLLFCFVVGQAKGQSVTKSRFIFFGKCTTTEKIIRDTVLITKTDTVRVLLPADTTAILAKYCKRDTIVDIPTEPKDTLFRALYLNGFANIVGNKQYEEALLFDLQRWKFNATYAYSLSSILGTSKEPALADLHKRMRAIGIKEIGAARGNSASCTGAATTFNKKYPDESDFDTWNLEFEPWNAYPMATSPYWTIDKDKASSTTSTTESRGLAWNVNKQYLNEMKAGKANGQVEYSVDYFGWFKEPFVTDAPKVLVSLTDYLIVHMYYSEPTFSRSKSRCDELNAQAKLQNKTVKFRPIFSAEPDFMQGYYKKNSIDQAFFVWHKDFKAQNYSNLISDGYVIFALDFLRVAQPGVTPLARGIESDTTEYLPAFVDIDFVNETTDKSKALAEEE